MESEKQKKNYLFENVECKYLPILLKEHRREGGRERNLCWMIGPCGKKTITLYTQDLSAEEPGC